MRRRGLHRQLRRLLSRQPCPAHPQRSSHHQARPTRNCSLRPPCSHPLRCSGCLLHRQSPEQRKMRRSQGRPRRERKSLLHVSLVRGCDVRNRGIRGNPPALRSLPTPFRTRGSHACARRSTAAPAQLRNLAWPCSCTPGPAHPSVGDPHDSHRYAGIVPNPCVKQRWSLRVKHAEHQEFFDTVPNFVDQFGDASRSLTVRTRLLTMTFPLGTLR